MRNPLLAFLLVAAVLLESCGSSRVLPEDDDDVTGDDDTAPDDDDDTTGDDDVQDDDATGDDDSADCPFPAPAAAMISVGDGWSPWAHSPPVWARTYDRPFPDIYETTAEEGQCRFLELSYGDCSPPCVSGEVCTIHDECESWPALIAGGPLTVTGGGEPIVVDEADWCPGYYVGPGELAEEFAAPGVPVGASLAGGTFPAITLMASGVDAIDGLAANGEGIGLDPAYLILEDGHDATLTWTPGSVPDACIQITIHYRTEGHGGFPAERVQCVGRDDGSLVILAATFAGLPPLDHLPIDVAGFDYLYSEIVRYTSDEVDTEYGPAELRVCETEFFEYLHLE